MHDLPACSPPFSPPVPSTPLAAARAQEVHAAVDPAHTYNAWLQIET